MSNFRIVPVDAAWAARLRQTRQDDFGHPLKAVPATGRGPCRVSLRPFTVGVDMRILAAYSPFSQASPYAETGPIFISAEAVAPYTDVHRFPPKIKADKVHFPLSLLGYSAAEHMVYTEQVGDQDIDQRIEQVFATRPEVAFLHVRNSEACCFICKVERR
ncbi:DUF1203 domain-containing protein [Hymenobacter weizhouensis]|uniref:DUF1203 domain-containing protein n=1 Tax=Hymenobacter sp. YIM 151500-1 TaxID=2987689 RepID=UPI002227FF2C|nr:DUF1203 domain-containing protein [Hymenobacter sp. YIM 151500-1]UYZ64367.1 DUF1203 domain-containing protein [Hymenobacter sp. YIM 151500-1]